MMFIVEARGIYLYVRCLSGSSVKILNLSHIESILSERQIYLVEHKASLQEAYFI